MTEWKIEIGFYPTVYPGVMLGALKMGDEVIVSDYFALPRPEVYGEIGFDMGEALRQTHPQIRQAILSRCSHGAVIGGLLDDAYGAASSAANDAEAQVKQLAQAKANEIAQAGLDEAKSQTGVDVSTMLPEGAPGYQAAHAADPEGTQVATNQLRKAADFAASITASVNQMLGQATDAGSKGLKTTGPVLNLAKGQSPYDKLREHGVR